MSDVVVGLCEGWGDEDAGIMECVANVSLLMWH